MENDFIPDGSISASSVLNIWHDKYYARPNTQRNGPRGWCANAADKQPYLQIHLSEMKNICGLGTMGRGESVPHYGYPVSYIIQLSNDSFNWTSVKEGIDKKVSPDLQRFCGTLLDEVEILTLTVLISRGEIPLEMNIINLYCKDFVSFVREFGNSLRLLDLFSPNRFSLVQIALCINFGSIGDDSYWISNCLKMIELSCINKASLNLIYSNILASRRVPASVFK